MILSRPGRRRIGTLIGILLLLPIVALAKAPANDPVIAQVGDETITAKDFVQVVAGLDPQTHAKAMKDHAALIQLVQAELGRRAILALARAQHWDRKPAIAAQARHAAEDVIITSFLDAAAAPPPSFPSAADIQRVYQANLSRFMTPRQYHLAQIYVARPANGTPDALAAAARRAQALGQAASAPNTDFATLARQSSDDHDSAAQGGDLGWVSEKAMVPEILQAVAGLDQGDISPPVESVDGWHILKALGTKPAAPEPLSDARPTIIALLRQSESQRLQQAFVADLLNRGHAEADLDKFQAVLSTSP